MVSALHEVSVSCAPEMEVLLCCARIALDVEHEARLRSLVREDLDWERLTRMAALHGLVPLLYVHLCRACPDQVPAARLQALRARVHASAIRNMVLTRELIGLNSALCDAGVSFMPFKGLCLGYAVYGNGVLRKGGDIDLLVPLAHVPAGREVMLSRGYRLETPVRADGAPINSGKYEYHFKRDRDDMIVELRWRITQQHFGATLDLDELSERSVPLRIGETTVPSLCDEDLLLVLCLHGTKHFWARLMWVCDLGVLIDTRPALDWDLVLERAARVGGVRMLLLGLRLAHHLLGTPLPRDVLRRVQEDPHAHALAAQIEELVFNDPEGRFLPFEIDDENDRRLYHFQVADRFSDRVRFLAQVTARQLAPTSRDRSIVSLPGWLGPLYYVFRPIRLAFSYGVSRLQRRRTPEKSLPEAED